MVRSKLFYAYENLPEGLDATKDLIGDFIRNGMNQLSEQAIERGYTILWDTLKFEPEITTIDEGTFLESYVNSVTNLRLEAMSVKTSTVEELLALGASPQELLAKLRAYMDGDETSPSTRLPEEG